MRNETTPTAPTVVAGQAHLTIEDVVALAHGEARVALSTDPAWRRRVALGCEELARRLERGETVYGVNTGYGDSCERAVAGDRLRALPRNLVRYHGCGLGRELDEAATAAVLAARIASLARGFSGVRLELLERLCALLNERVLPVIPEEGSVGASGDLTPLSYVAATLIGEREAYYRGQRVPSIDALRAARIEPIELAPKEGLALMNGTAVMTGIAALAFDRARSLLDLGCRVTGLDVVALRGNRAHFAARLFELKPQRGSARAAASIRAMFAAERAEPAAAQRIQDPYSLRCAPHVLGVLGDALDWIREWLEIELNSANDNPLVDGENELVLHGGHFYGGHVAFAMDALKTAVANVADLLDRQLALLVDESRNRGLPANLSGAPEHESSVHHGLKGVQISASAWTAEALKASLPASVFSRSTECHNQDKVSLGTIAARDAMRVVELTEQVAVAAWISAVQGVRLRSAREPDVARWLSPSARALVDATGSWFPPLDADRALDATLRAGLERLRARPLASAHATASTRADGALAARSSGA